MKAIELKINYVFNGHHVNNEKVTAIINSGNLNNLAPIVVYEEAGDYVAIDGNHRLAANKKIGAESVMAYVVPREVLEKAKVEGYEWESISQAVYNLTGHDIVCDGAYAEEVSQIIDWLVY